MNDATNARPQGRTEDDPNQQSRLQDALEAEVNLQMQEDLDSDAGDIYEEALPDARGADPDSGGQSGDTQGLSDNAQAGAESVEELTESGQSFEAEVISGVEDAADHPEQPLYVREREMPPAF